MQKYKVYTKQDGTPCYKIHMAWSDNAQPRWRGRHREFSDLVPMNDVLIWDAKVGDFVIDEDFLDEWLQTSIDNDYQGDDYEEDVWDATWSLEVER